MAEITVIGLEPILAKLAKMGRADEFLDRAMGQSVAAVEKIARKYPPVPSGSKYVRTFRLQNAWYTGANGLTGWVRNVGPHYNVYVQGDGSQTAQHAGTGWKTESEIAGAASEQVMAIVQAEIARAMR